MTIEPDDLSSDEFEADLVKGAAEDSAAGEQESAKLPRVLRYAILASRAGNSVYQRLAAEIETACPGVGLTPAWLDRPDAASGTALAAELDRLAVVEDRSEYRGLADCVRLLSLSLPRDTALRDEHRRVAHALLAALCKLPEGIPASLAAKVETVTYGWAALQVCGNEVVGAFETPAIVAAATLGARMAQRRLEEAAETAFARAREHSRKSIEAEAASRLGPVRGGAAVPADHVLVVRTDAMAMAGPKLRDITAPLKRVIDVPLPLVRTPPLAEVGRQLLAEFPYAGGVIDFVLSDLIARPTVGFRPLLMVGPPGSGKTRFAGRLQQLLGVAMWRTDSSGADGSAFGGTDRRWATAQVCHPLLAIARAGHANPLILLDELDKAATGKQYGCLLDCLLGFLEDHTARHYPDPALQAPVDLRHVCYVATANSADNLPSPLRDRMREIVFPKPEEKDLEALLPAVIADILRDRGMDLRWIGRLTPNETGAIAHHWGGGSMRKLCRIVEVVLHTRDVHARRH